MGIGEWIAWVLLLLLALYGCASLMRRIILRITRCPETVRCYHLAVPPTGKAIEPLFRCLQAQATWEETGCRQTLVVLPPLTPAEQAMAWRLATENPAVRPVTVEELTEILSVAPDY